jgi:hypothetical protein
VSFKVRVLVAHISEVTIRVRERPKHSSCNTNKETVSYDRRHKESLHLAEDGKDGATSCTHPHAVTESTRLSSGMALASEYTALALIIPIIKRSRIDSELLPCERITTMTVQHARTDAAPTVLVASTM